MWDVERVVSCSLIRVGATVATRKQQEIAEMLRRQISNIALYELRDPRVGFVTVTRIELAGDFRSAKVYVTVRGSRADVSKSLGALRHARGRIQGLIGERLELRYTPLLEFVEDIELDKALRVDRLIDEVMRQDEESGN